MSKNRKVTKEQKKYQNLEERYEEMQDYLLDLIQKHERADEELRYLYDFVHYHKLDEAFRYFREYAHEEEDSELPFPYLVL